MQEKENIFLPYTIGFVALTAAAVVGLTSTQNLLPSKTYNLSGLDVAYSWDAELTYTPFEKVDSETLLQFKTIQSFADRLYEEITDLDPQIVEMVDDKFWDLLA